MTAGVIGDAEDQNAITYTDTSNGITVGVEAKDLDIDIDISFSF